MLERYGHGGDLLTAQETFGLPKERFTDFSSNMNPLGPPPCVREIVAEGWKDIHKYPDPAVRALRGKLAHKYGIDPESILVGNGAAELIDLIVRVLKPERTGLARPSFSEYEEAVHKTDGKLLSIPLLAGNGFALAEPELELAISSTDLLFLGHPNNPTGRLISRDVLDMLLRSKRRLVLDEAFMDFIEDEGAHSMLRLASQSRELIVIRSMTKFYSIPGIRLGFMVAHPELIREARRLQVQWSVNDLAQRIGCAVLEDEPFEAASRRWLSEEKPWLSAQLGSLGLEVIPSDVNFLLFSFPKATGMTAAKAQQLLGQMGILIRDASRFEGLDERFCRAAVRLRADNENLVVALSTILEAFPISGGRGGVHHEA
ncbi:threonine-phosphate decarboxylase CobD [Paenibacillus oryzisoli]|uniref:threonine-phosphate decarboxylase CobD n=1 Tax=Paenibacillus oryzisoli TaxID=1850517 RepID=UPI003D27D04C